MSCFPCIAISDCICEYTYCNNHELRPLYCNLRLHLWMYNLFYPRVASLTLWSQIAFVNISTVINMSCIPYIVISDCICEYTYCNNHELRPLYCDLMIAFVNIPTVMTMSRFPYIVILGLHLWIYKLFLSKSCFPYIVILWLHLWITCCYNLELLPLILISDCICEFTYCNYQELLPLHCDLRLHLWIYLLK